MLQTMRSKWYIHNKVYNVCELAYISFSSYIVQINSSQNYMHFVKYVYLDEFKTQKFIFEIKSLKKNCLLEWTCMLYVYPMPPLIRDNELFFWFCDYKVPFVFFGFCLLSLVCKSKNGKIFSFGLNKWYIW